MTTFGLLLLKSDYFGEKMLQNQMVTLEGVGKELLKKASLATRAVDVREFTELGLKCLAESRQVALTLRTNSLLFYLELHALARTSPDYGEYVDFCARNNLVLFSEEDFLRLIREIEMEIKSPAE